MMATSNQEKLIQLTGVRAHETRKYLREHYG